MTTTSEGTKDPMQTKSPLQRSGLQRSHIASDGGDKLKLARKNQWIEASMYFEVMAVTEEFAKSAMEEHIAKLNKIPGALIEKADFLGIKTIEKPMEGVEKAWSQVCRVTLFAKDFDTLLTAVYLYGPASIEIISPANKTLSMDEMQKITNSLSSLVHKFAQAGIGGIVIVPNAERHAPGAM